MIALIVAAATVPAAIDAPIYVFNGEASYVLGFRAHGSAESLTKFKHAVDQLGWPNITVADAGEPAFLSIILKGVSKEAYEALLSRANAEEFGPLTFESMILPVPGKKK